MKAIAIKVKTDGAGSGTATSPEPVSGTIAEIRNPNVALNNAGAADVTVTRPADGAQVLKLANADGPWSKVPQQPVVTNEGAPALFAAGGAPIMEEIPVDGYLKVQVAEGKANAEGEIVVFVDGDDD